VHALGREFMESVIERTRLLPRSEQFAAARAARARLLAATSDAALRVERARDGLGELDAAVAARLAAAEPPVPQAERPQVEAAARVAVAAQHDLLAQAPDLTVIALRATSYPAARVSRRVLLLNDRTIGLLAEILLAGRARGDLSREADVLASARALFHSALGARVSWANGLLDETGCRTAIETSVDLLFRGIGRAAAQPPAPEH